MSALRRRIGKAQRLELHKLDINAKLFVQLAPQCFPRGLTRFDLPAGVLPKATMLLTSRTPLKQVTTIGSDDVGGDYQQHGWLSPGRTRQRNLNTFGAIDVSR